MLQTTPDPDVQFETDYRTYFRSLVKHIAFRLRHQLAEDAAQEVFLRYLIHLRERPSAPPSGVDNKWAVWNWLRLVAKHACLDQRRALSRKQRTAEAACLLGVEIVRSIAPPYEDRRLYSDGLRAVVAQVLLLPRREKTCVVAKFWRDEPSRVTALHIGMSSRMARLHCQQGIARVRRRCALRGESTLKT